MTDLKPTCIYCGLGSDQMPLIAFKYQDQDYWICAQHLPLVIHEPAKLAGKLPGAEKLKTSGH